MATVVEDKFNHSSHTQIHANCGVVTCFTRQKWPFLLYREITLLILTFSLLYQKPGMGHSLSNKR